MQTRNFNQQPPKPTLILSSTEALAIAQAVHSELQVQTDAIECTIWTQVQFSGWFLSALVEKVEEHAFVIIVLSPDDSLISRKKRSSAPRDNLLLELGMAIAANGDKRVFILCPRIAKFKVPTDLAGLILHHYDIQ